MLESGSARKPEASVEARILLDRWPNEVRRDRIYNLNLFLETEVPMLDC